MTPAVAPTLFTEATLSVEPTSPASVLHIPTESSSLFASRKRPRSDGSALLDETDYARRYLATESSIFFRQATKTPRSILWRVLNDRKSLELQCVDLIQDKSITQESLLTFSLGFSSPIRQNGIAFADSHSHDALEVFVLTSSNELFTFSLRRDLLLRATVPLPSDFQPSACFKTYGLSSFTFRHPYKLVALSDLQLLISLHDGSLLRLQRRGGDSGASWYESYLHEGSWGQSLKGLISWKGQNTVRWGNLDLSSNAATAMSITPDDAHIFTASLDHTLKAWNAKTGKPGIHLDLLGESRSEGRGSQQHLIDADQRSVMKVVDVEQRPDGDAYYVVVYSPREHQFKFWAIKDADSQEYGYRDMHSDLRLIPPLDELMNTNVWQLTDFEISPGPSWKDAQFWIRARSGPACRTFTVTFDLLGSSDDLEYAWKHQWAAVDAGSMAIEHLCSLPEYRCLQEAAESGLEHVDLSDEWLDYLLFPGRFSSGMLETAIYMYRKGLGLTNSLQLASSNQSIQQRLRDSVMAKVGVTRDDDGYADLQKYNSDLGTQWRTFFGLVKHLAQRRAEPLSIALDLHAKLCWSIRSDHVAPVRACSEIETYALNEDIWTEQDDEWILNSMPLADYLPDDTSLSAARLHAAARSFRGSLSGSFNRILDKTSSNFALHDATVDFRGRVRKGQSTPLQKLYNICDFSGEVGDDEFTQLTEAVRDIGGLGHLENNLFDSLLDRISESPRGQDSEHALARYGDKATIRGAQDTLIEGRQTILDLLCLVTFMSQDLETDELSKGFKAMELYSSLASQLREIGVLLWLSSHSRFEQVKGKQSSGQEDRRLSETHSPQPATTVLQSIFIGDWSSMAFPKEGLADLLTYWSRAWTFGASLDANYDGVTAHIVSNLIKCGDYALAYDFARFLPCNSWTTYLRGRLYLHGGEYKLAATSFRQCAADLSSHSTGSSKPIQSMDTSRCISPIELESFNAGLPRMYLHITSLFEAAKLHSYAADFASLANDAFEGEADEGLDSSIMEIDTRKRHLQDSPASMQLDLGLEEIQLLKKSVKASEFRSEILTRLFSNTLATHRFGAAFDALVKMSDSAVKRASLQQLLKTILSTSPSSLLTLSFPSDLHSEVDSALSSLARQQLTATKAPPSTEPQYHRLLYAYRINRNDFRGAAEGLHERLQFLLSLSTKDYDKWGFDEDEGVDLGEEEEGGLGREVLDTYLLLINALACCGAEEGWILAEPFAKEGMAKEGKRKVVTLEDVRRGYQAELDRRSEIAQGRFAIVGGGGGEVMDVDFS